jgi:hypothetical protein
MALGVLPVENISICYIMYNFYLITVIYCENYSRTEHRFSQRMDITSKILLKLKIWILHHFRIFDEYFYLYNQK